MRTLPELFSTSRFCKAKEACLCVSSVTTLCGLPVSDVEFPQENKLMDEQERCPICRLKVDRFEYDAVNDLTSTINCVRCGQFRVSGEVAMQIGSTRLENYHRYAGAIRELNERGVPLPQITDLDSFLYQVVVPKDPLEMMDRFLLCLRNESTRAGQYVVLSEHDYALAYCRDQEEWGWIISQMAEMSLIEPWSGSHQFRIRPAGWKRLTDLSTIIRTSDQAFVAMSFSPELDTLFDDGIEPALRETHYVPLRVDRREHNEKIDDYIIAEVRKSALMIADFTQQRNGVYFEAGLALGLAVPIVWCCKDDKMEIKNLHFDTRQFNHIVWKNPQDLRTKLINRINATVPAKVTER